MELHTAIVALRNFQGIRDDRTVWVDKEALETVLAHFDKQGEVVAYLDETTRVPYGLREPVSKEKMTPLVRKVPT